MAKNVEQADIELIQSGQSWLMYGRTARGKAIAQSAEGPPGPDGADRIVDSRVLLTVISRLLVIVRASVAVFPQGA